MNIVFGTDGWRARIADEYTFDAVRVCAQSVAEWVHKNGGADRGVVIGFDRRAVGNAGQRVDRGTGRCADEAERQCVNGRVGVRCGSSEGEQSPFVDGLVAIGLGAEQGSAALKVPVGSPTTPMANPPVEVLPVLHRLAGSALASDGTLYVSVALADRSGRVLAIDRASDDDR